MWLICGDFLPVALRGKKLLTYFNRIHMHPYAYPHAMWIWLTKIHPKSLLRERLSKVPDLTELTFLIVLQSALIRGGNLVYINPYAARIAPACSAVSYNQTIFF